MTQGPVSTPRSGAPHAEPAGDGTPDPTVADRPEALPGSQRRHRWVPPRVPDAFLVGAQKAATSSLMMLLGRHPDVVPSKPKEPHYFNFDTPGARENADPDAYAAMFADAPEGAITLDGSASYLSSPTAAAAIAEANPEARIIISLRDPAEAVISWYHQMRDGLREDQQSFEQAWALQEERAAGRKLPTYCPNPPSLQYRAIYAYATHLERFRAHFPEDQIHILFYDDLRADPAGTITDLAAFLGLHRGSLPDSLPHQNARRAPRYPRLRQFIAAPPRVLRPLVKPAKSLSDRLGIQVSKVMMNRFSVAPAPDETRPSEATLSMLRAAFADEVARVEEMTGRDLSHWRNPVAGTTD